MYYMKASHFIGRENLVRQALRMLNTTKAMNERERKGIALTLVGKSGSGKTSLISKLAYEFVQQHNSVPLIIRYCGTSALSMHVKDLLQSINLQILFVYDQHSELQELLKVIPSQTFDEVIASFEKHLLQYPVFLFIDSIDQLETSRNLIALLNNCATHEQSKIIVSLLQDDRPKESTLPLHQQSLLVADSVHVFHIEAIGLAENTNETENLVTILVARHHRCLTEEQKQLVLNAIQSEPIILYATLLQEIVRKWRSFDPPLRLETTVKGIIHQIFEALETDFGYYFTRRAFSLITFAREGISDLEMQDLLSLDDDVLTESFQYSTLNHFPMHSWLRLKSAIQNLVTETREHCIRWNHRQLWETARERYELDKKSAHQLLGHYFGSRLDNNMTTERMIHPQELTINSVPIFLSSSEANRRRAVEAAFNLLEGCLYEEALEEICRFESICASALAGDAFHLLQLLNRLRKNFPPDSDSFQKAQAYFEWLRREVSTIVKNPREHVLSTASSEARSSLVYRDFLVFVNGVSNRTTNWRATDHYILRETFLREPRVDQSQLELSIVEDLGYGVIWHPTLPVLATTSLEGVHLWDPELGRQIQDWKSPIGRQKQLSWTVDWSKFAGTDDSDNTRVYVFDGKSGSLLKTLTCSKPINCQVAWSPDGKHLAAGCKDGTVVMWDVESAQETVIREAVPPPKSEYSFLNDKEIDTIHSFSWNRDGSKLAIAFTQLVIWERSSQNLITLLGNPPHRTISSPDDGAQELAWQNNSILASSSRDTIIKIWDTDKGTLILGLNILQKIRYLTWSPEGTRLAAGDEKGYIQIWDVHDPTQSCHKYPPREGTVVSRSLKFSAHSGMVLSLSWNAEGTKLASHSLSDGFIQVWDVAALKYTETNIAFEHTFPKFSAALVSAGAFDPHDWRSGYDQEFGTLLDDLFQMMAISVTGNKIATISGERLDLWSLHPCQKIRTFQTDNRVSLEYVCWSPNGQLLATSSRDKLIRIWYIADNRAVKLTGDCGPVGIQLKCPLPLAWSNDGKRLASTQNNSSQIQVWDVDREICLWTVNAPYAGPPLLWSFDDSKLFCGSETIRVWDTHSGREIFNHKLNRRLLAAAWHPRDGTLLALGFQYADIEIWDLNLGKQIRQFKARGNEDISALAWIEEGAKLLCCSKDGSIESFWDVSENHAAPNPNPNFG